MTAPPPANPHAAPTGTPASVTETTHATATASLAALHPPAGAPA